MTKYGIGKCEYVNSEPTKDFETFDTFASTEPIVSKNLKITKKDKEIWHFIKLERFKNEYYKHLQERYDNWYLGDKEK